MTKRPVVHLVQLIAVLLSAAKLNSATGPLPVRGLHMWVPKPQDVSLLVRFIEDALPKEGVNTLVLEFDYKYRFHSHPEVSDPDALSETEVKQIVSACRKSHVELIPLIGLLGHQSHSKDRMTLGLLRSHPEFDETPGKYPGNVGTYARSYCPLHPNVHNVVFDLIDELMKATEAKSFHAGMDEVLLLGEDECPRCRGKLKAELFGNEVQRLRDHLAEKHRRLWIWGDRLLDGTTTGVGEWEGSFNGTYPAVNMVPKDIVICDWHYAHAEPTAAYFAAHGFDVVSCPWNQPNVGRDEVMLQQVMRRNANDTLASKFLGVLQTSWQDPAEMIHMYFGELPLSPGRSGDSLLSFRSVFEQFRKDNSR